LNPAGICRSSGVTFGVTSSVSVLTVKITARGLMSPLIRRASEDLLFLQVHDPLVHVVELNFPIALDGVGRDHALAGGFAAKHPRYTTEKAFKLHLSFVARLDVGPEGMAQMAMRGRASTQVFSTRLIEWSLQAIKDCNA
jgi:hypothetical protein